MSQLSEQPLESFQRDLARKIPAPGGGAAAGVVAALGCGLAAMAARYTSGKRYDETTIAAAEQLALQVDQAAEHCFELGEQDAIAYARVQELKKAQATAGAISEAESTARNVPLSLLHKLDAQAQSIRDFKDRCNPWLISDLKAALHLLAGAGAAAWEMLVAGDPPAEERRIGHALCQHLIEMAQELRSPERSSG